MVFWFLWFFTSSVVLEDRPGLEDHRGHKFVSLVLVLAWRPGSWLGHMALTFCKSFKTRLDEWLQPAELQTQLFLRSNSSSSSKFMHVRHVRLYGYGIR